MPPGPPRQPPDARTVGRRRLAALGAAAGVALITGVSVGAGAGDGGDRTPAARGGAAQAVLELEQEAALRQVDRLSLRRQVGQVTVSSFPGTAMPDYIRRRLRARETAGVILFGSNGGDRAVWRRRSAWDGRAAAPAAARTVSARTAAADTAAVAPSRRSLAGPAARGSR